MHHAAIGASAVFIGQNTRHVVICIAGMDDQWQARLARGVYVNAQAFLLYVLAVGGVMVIQPRFANAHHFRVFGHCDQFRDTCHGFICHAHGVGAAAKKTPS